MSFHSPFELITHFSVEGLQTLGIGSGRSTGLKIGEYSTIFEINGRKGQGNTIPELTDMYDGGFINTALLGRAVNAENYLVSILAGSTASWLESFVQGKNIAGGFTNRHACFSGVPRQIIPFQKEIPPEKFRRLVEQFSELIPRGLQGAEANDGGVVWTAERRSLQWGTHARNAWEAYYRERTGEMRSISGSIVSDLCARELTHALKFTGLAVTLDHKDLVERRHLEFGVRLARACIRNLANLLTNQQNTSTKDPHTRRIVELLRKRGPMTKQDLARALGGKQLPYNRAIEHMKIEGVILEEEENLLQLRVPTSNQFQDEVSNFLGKTGISEIFNKAELEVGCEIKLGDKEDAGFLGLEARS